MFYLSLFYGQYVLYDLYANGVEVFKLIMISPSLFFSHLGHSLQILFRTSVYSICRCFMDKMSMYNLYTNGHVECMQEGV